MSEITNESTSPTSSPGGPPPEDPLDSDLRPQHQIADDDTDAQITEKLKAQGVRLRGGSIAPAVFWPSLIAIVVVTASALIFPDFTSDVLIGAQSWLVTNLGWYYMTVIAAFIVFALYMCFSRFGRIKLGRDGEEPEFSWLSWFAMLFSAGMGVGLVFYGVAEPLTYATSSPKPGWTGDEVELAQLGMAQTFVHWGLHPWAIYAVIGLALAYAIHRRGRPVSIRWALEPLLGEKRVQGWMGDVIDILAVFGTIAGVATSLGLGVQQIGAGLAAMGVVESADMTLLIILIVVITFLATASVVTGLGRGIKWLSNINLSLAGILLIAVLLLGPTLFMFQNFIQSLGVYLANVLNMSFDVGAYQGEEGAAWGAAWTIFYWGWWVSWAPFVGVFIARISRGRTVRQFVAGVLLVPTTVGFFWFSVMGGAGLFRQLFGEGGLVDPEEGVIAESALFDLLADMPIGGILSVLAIVVIAIFFITSSDSGSLVVDMLASGGHPNPPTWSRVTFAVLEGLIAAALLLAGGLTVIQAAGLITALPFSVILILMAIATVKAMRTDLEQMQDRELEQRYRRVSEMLQEDFDSRFGEQVDTRVDHRIDYRLSRTTGPVTGRFRRLKGNEKK